MIKVDQTDTTFITGNCMQACVASIFEVGLNKIPNFMRRGPASFEEYLSDWCTINNLIYHDFTCADELLDIFKGCYLIATGTSPRCPKGKNNHAVVWFNEEIVHDPHPRDKRGIIGTPKIYGGFMLKDASNYKLEPNP